MGKGMIKHGDPRIKANMAKLAKYKEEHPEEFQLSDAQKLLINQYQNLRFQRSIERGMTLDESLTEMGV